MDSALPAIIRAAREAAGMAAKDLAATLGVSPSAMSLIESGGRSLKASELVAIASALGISPLALIEPDSLAGRVSIAARTTEATQATESPLLRRLQGMAEVASLLDPESDKATSYWAWVEKPAVDFADWLGSARALANWALRHSGEGDSAGDRFIETAMYIQFALGVDVIVEGFDDPVIGGAIVGQELPLIVINSIQGRQRALFTLAHELGHVLADDGQQIACDVDFSAHSPGERFANAFAAEFLLPIAKVQNLMEGVSDIRSAVLRLMIHGGLSKQTSIYRLHNLGIINATQRDALMRLHPSEMAAVETDETVRRLLLARSDELSPRIVTPVRLLGRLVDAYRDGVVSAAPLAGLLGCDIDEVIERYGVDFTADSAPGIDMRSSSPSLTTEAAYDGVPA